MTATDSFGHEDHKWIGRTVRDIPSGTEGELTAVVHEKKRNHVGQLTGVRLAYIKKADGLEFPTAATNIELVC